MRSLDGTRQRQFARSSRPGVLIAAASLLALVAMPATTAAAGPTVFSGAGTANAAAAFSAFKAALGGVDNGGNPPPQASGFRTINWDGVRLDGTDFGANTHVIVPGKVVGIPINRFQARGAEFEEEYAVSGDGFVSTNPGVAGQFNAFSPNNTFAMFNDNTIGMSFVLPSAPNTPPVQAATRGFGAIFLDVEKPNTSSIEYFSGSTSLGKFYVPAGPSGQADFLGVVFDTPIVTSVELDVGDAQIFSLSDGSVISGPPDLSLGGSNDLAATDDFAYGEPVCPRTITGTVGSVTVTSGQVACISGATVTGDLVVQGGVVTVVNTTVNGQLSASAPDLLVACGSTVNGPVTVQGATGFVRLGDAGNDDQLSCAANTLRNQVTLVGNRGGFEVGGNQIAGSLTANGNGGAGSNDDEALEIEGNVIGGNLSCTSNSTPVTNDGHPNSVAGTRSGQCAGL